MGITVDGRKLQIDGKRAASGYTAYEDASAYHEDGYEWRFIDLKDEAGRVARIAVILNGELESGMSAKAALSRKIIMDEVRSLLDDELHLKERCRTDRRALGLFDILTEVASQDSRYMPLREHIEMEIQLGDNLNSALVLLKERMAEAVETGSYDEETVDTILDDYVRNYLFPLEYEIQVKGYLLQADYSDLHAGLSAKKFRLGRFKSWRLRKHTEMMAGLDMKNTPWITILEENLEKPLNEKTGDEKMIAALKRHLNRQSELKAGSIIYSECGLR
ncbi:MAG TPA: hypothetical protein H9891_01185 [Candidatus Salinicoccus stercoripullorum]|uniref:Uncharacterized protein n=1 Tax=Candidatus Salinicoccus stercoripullorum TaxID=2838756 RepID=A0A9D1QFS4_9STAP|nr:hypothetical protein [Candidatus Salinicoccus stercoripullorum]